MKLVETLRRKFDLISAMAFSNEPLSNSYVRSRIAEIAQSFVHSDKETRRFFEQNGVHILPVNFYSGFPTLADIETTWEKTTSNPYIDAFPNELSAIERELELLVPFVRDFDFPMEGSEESPTSFFFKNSQFSYSDCFLYYGMIRKLKPKVVLEIGSGFSTLLAVEATKRNESGKVICVEPYPREFLKSANVELIQTAIQDRDAAKLIGLLSDGDILFIDSTHTVKAGSDCLWIYLKLLPELIRSGKKTYVHVHDIFWPNSMPDSFTVGAKLSWTEQYLLMALLVGNDKAKYLFSSEYARVFCPDRLGALSGRYSKELGGGSFWFLVN